MKPEKIQRYKNLKKEGYTGTEIYMILCIQDLMTKLRL